MITSWFADRQYGGLWYDLGDGRMRCIVCEWINKKAFKYGQAGRRQTGRRSQKAIILRFEARTNDFGRPSLGRRYAALFLHLFIWDARHHQRSPTFISSFLNLTRFRLVLRLDIRLVRQILDLLAELNRREHSFTKLRKINRSCILPQLH